MRVGPRGQRLLPAASGRQQLTLLRVPPLHSPVLKPDLHLALGQAERSRHLHAPLAVQVRIKQELLLQLERLVAAVRLSAAPSAGSYRIKESTQ